MNRPLNRHSVAEIADCQDELADWFENWDPDFSQSPPPIPVPAGTGWRFHARLATAAIRAELQLPAGVPVQFTFDRTEQSMTVHPDSAGAVAATANALVEVAHERGRQRRQTDYEHDDAMQPTEWLALHTQLLEQISEADDPATTRAHLVRGCATYAAHLEAINRKHPELQGSTVGEGTEST